MRVSKSWFVFGFIALSSCGSRSSGDSPSTSITNDNASNVGSSAIDSVTDAMSEGTTANTSGLVDQSSDLAASEVDITVTRTCTANTPATGNAQVVWQRSGSGTITKTIGRWSVLSTIAGSGQETRDWVAPTGKTVACNAASNGVRFDWTDSALVNGLKMTAAVKRSHDLTNTWTNSRTGKTRSNTHKVATDGIRTATWSSLATTNTGGVFGLTATKTVTLNHTVTATTPTDSDTSVTRSAKIVTDISAPLAVAVVRSGPTVATSVITSKTITSGTVVSTDTTDGATDGPVTKLSFSNVKYDLTTTNANKCIPVSGSITGNIYANAAATTATKTFVITFGSETVDSTVAIAYDGGTALELSYSYNGCDLTRE